MTNTRTPYEARIAMGWPVFAVNSTLAYLAIRTAIRALPRTGDADEDAQLSTA